MVTTEVFENLKSLQEILVQKYELEGKKSDAPKQLSNQEDLLAKTQKEFIEQKSNYDATQEKVTQLKAQLEEAVKSREEGEKGVANSTTHREYEALEKQITEAKTLEEQVRKDLQHEEKDLAELNERLKNSEELIKFQESELNSSRESLNKELSSYDNKLAKLKVEEDKVTKNINMIYAGEENAELKAQEILFKFQRIIQRNSEGIVSVRNGVCSGCHMILPANFANEVREGEDINFCPYCSRILYYEEVSEDQAEDYFDIGAAGSLAGLDDEFEDEDSEYGDDEEKEERSEFDDEEEFDEESEDSEDEDEDSDDDSDEDEDEE
ncbi:zinc ribbon domain-containing protein [Treponema bryantii]|uniref:zinc ribbon domain-containing protein n=1 Tax=Treponema bryantii TaxID=163 RepID=UPI0003B35A56|nr:C4-type zinc ribbon domain-containing protein [Treponema bryantii]